MNWQTILYFSSIFLTFTVTGFLAWYAWRQPALPGVRTYAWMALSECLLALGEMLSMLSGTEVQAQFWFSVRFIFTAIIPVFWMIFAMEYNGRKEWLSKRLITGLFIVPLITQGMIWSNSLHGLWVKREMSFHQYGFMWLAEVGTRIPGIWFMVHTFYSIFLLLAGIGVILVTAWRQRRIYRAQALLLTVGTLVSLLTGAIPIFNVFPELEFNPFIPGIGVAALLYALAIFNFQLLKSPPSPSTMARFEVQEKRSLTILIFIFILFTTGITVTGYLTYQNYKEHFRTQVESEISAIAKLKVDELADWRKERLSDANVLHENPILVALVKRFFENPADSEARAQLQAWLASYRIYPDYDRVRLIDVQGNTYISNPTGLPPISSEVMQLIPEAVRSGEVTMVDFYRASDQNIYLGTLIPIVDKNADGQVIGLIVLSIDPQPYLFPFIQEWPVPSASAETLLIRQDGESAVFLNPLLYQADAALNLSYPLEQIEHPAVKAVLGEEGIIEGLDYREEEVIADIRKVPDSPWYLISKMDSAEVYAPLRARFWQTILFFGMLISMTWAGLLLVWRQQRVSYYKAQAETIDSLRASEEKFRLAFDISPDAITISQMEDGLFISVNKGFEHLTGYNRDIALSKTALELPLWKHPEDRTKIIEELRANGEVDNFESVFLTQHGEVYGLLSAVILPLNGKPHILSIARDITERKQAEEALKQSNQRFEALLSQAPFTGVIYRLIFDDDGQIVDWEITDINTLGAASIGMTVKDAIGKRTVALFGKETMEPYFEIARQVMASGKPQTFETYFAVNDRYYLTSVFMVGSNHYANMSVDITERKHAEEKLVESEKRYRLISENSADVIWTLDLTTGRFTYVSPSVFNLRGMTPEEVMEEPMQASITPESNQDIEENLPQRIARYLAGDISAKTRTSQVDQVRKDGSIVPTEVVTNLITNSEGKVVEVLGVSRDITERKLAEASIRESEANLSALIENTDGSIWAVDKQYGLIVGNREFHRNVSAVLGRHLEMGESLLQPEFPTQVNAEWREFYDRALRGERFTNETQTRFRDAPHYMEYRFSPIRDNTGEIRGATIFGRDITEQKVSEELLRENETRLRQALTAAKAGIWEWNLQTNQNFWSEELWKVYGLEPFSAEPCYDTWLATIHPEDRERAAQSVQDAARDEAELNVEWRVVEKDGTQRWLMSRGQPLRNPDGQATRFIGTVLDITERKQAEKQLLKTLEELERSNTELEQFAYVASHDLQEPLRAVAGMVQLLQKRYQGNLDERADEYINLAMDGATRMQTLITDLLEYSRVDRRGNPIQPTDANNALKAALGNLREAIHEGGVTVTNETLPTVDADATQLTQVFQNLIGNAIKFHSERPPQIHVAVKDLGNAWQFSVRDNGIGIEPQYFERIFLVFQRLHTRREYPGTGIGLSICKKIIERHAGRLWIESQPGQGTTFYFTIPYRS